MTAKLLDGREIAGSIREENIKELEFLKERGIFPKLVAVLVGKDPASVYYANSKERACKGIGMGFDLISLSPETTDNELLAVLEDLNNDISVHGIMVELPLPGHINKQRIYEGISPLKDIDGIHPINRGYILSGGKGLLPATPLSCIELMLRSGIEIQGKNAVIVGRGETVGKPLVFMLLSHHATVTVCHTRTRDLSYHTRQADILVAAAGKAGLIKADMIKKGAVVVDAGINEMDGGGICGDVDFDAARKVAGYISPVPGGVGSLTTAIIQQNVLRAVSLIMNQ